MDPMNSQAQSVNPTNPTPVSVPPAGPAPEQVGNPVPKTQKRFLFYGVLLGLFAVSIVGVAAFYMMFSPKSNNQVAIVPTQAPVVTSEPTPIEVAQVEQIGDLDNLIVGLAQADGSLDQELSLLEKDSDF